MGIDVDDRPIRERNGALLTESRCVDWHPEILIPDRRTGYQGDGGDGRGDPKPGTQRLRRAQLLNVELVRGRLRWRVRYGGGGIRPARPVGERHDIGGICRSLRNQRLRVPLQIGVECRSLAPDGRNLEVGREVFGRFTGPEIKPSSTRVIEIAGTKLNEPLAG